LYEDEQEEHLCVVDEKNLKSIIYLLMIENKKENSIRELNMSLTLRFRLHNTRSIPNIAMLVSELEP
jgi:hypothetical protein